MPNKSPQSKPSTSQPPTTNPSTSGENPNSFLDRLDQDVRKVADEAAPVVRNTAEQLLDKEIEQVTDELESESSTNS